jgi:hypothetical protein
MYSIEVKAIKVTVGIKAEELPTDCIAPDGQPAPPVDLTLTCGGVTLNASLNGKAYRKAMKTVVPGAFAAIQGKLGDGNKLIECGLTIQAPKPVTQEPPAS